jgi:hypothetical protein
VIDAASGTLATALAAAFKLGAETNAPPLGQMATAFVAFWTGMAFLEAGVPPPVTGVVNFVPAAPTLSGALSIVFVAGLADPPPGVSDQASALGKVFDDFTRGVTVQNIVTVGGATSTVPLT